MKRSRILLLSALTLVLLLFIAVGVYYYSNKIAADEATQNTEAWKVQLMVLTIDPQSGKGTLSAYGSNGLIFTPQAVYVGTSPTKVAENIYQPSIAGCGTSGQTSDATCMTSLGVYSALDWTKPLGGNLSGEWFLNLSGQPAFGGDPVCSTKESTRDGKPCRHLGIHFTSNDATHGCIGVPNSTVCTTLTNSIPDNSGIKVIVTDYAIRGTVSPVDPESYNANFSNPKKIDKGHFASTSNVTGYKTYNFGSTWIAEVAAPNGKFTVSSSAPGYKNDVSSIDIVRDAGHKVTSVNGQNKTISTEMSSILALDKIMMAMKTNYFNSFYDEGYQGYYRVSSWDQTFMSTGGNSLSLSIGDQFPTPIKMQGATQKILADTMFGVFVNTTPWHDLGYGHYFAAPGYGKRIGVFSIDYNNVPKLLDVSLDTSGLTETEKAQMYKWGVAVVKIKALNHQYNDYIGLNSIKGKPGSSSSSSTTTTPTTPKAPIMPTGGTAPATPISQPTPPGVNAPTSGNTLSSPTTSNTTTQPLTSTSSAPKTPVVWYKPATWLSVSGGNPTSSACQTIWNSYNTQKPNLATIPIWNLLARYQANTLIQQKATCDSLYPNG